MTDSKAAVIAWVTMIVAFLLTMTVVHPSDEEFCELGRGEWDGELSMCFYRGN